MIKVQNIIPNFSLLLVLIIINISSIPAYIKMIFAIFAITFIFPAGREIMFKSKLRKVRVALYTSIVFSFGLIFISSLMSFSIDEEIFAGFLLVFFFSSIGVFCYGIPASILAEVISTRYVKNRKLVSGLIHIGLGLFTVFFGLLSEDLEPGVFILPTICSAIFFLIDEFTRKNA
ncbi:hypothetical protein [Mesobacillus jeotgali]|uniref:hypothetical protein n=1 Tax=Mesobacillus jeotgali TaxID=129985 RepID=UPI0009A71553|nr:hypothetical protein [Mesobacillus jeotgali]